jgi:hypothetical protein
VSTRQKSELDALMRQLPLDFGGNLAEQRPLLKQLMTSHQLPAEAASLAWQTGRAVPGLRG